MKIKYVAIDGGGESIGEFETYDAAAGAIQDASREAGDGGEDAYVMTVISDLSKNQQAFVRAAKRAGLLVDYTYSGRGMFGDRCPAVRLDQYQEFRTRARVSRDQMGMGTVVYASS